MSIFDWFKKKSVTEEKVDAELKKAISQALFIEPDNTKQAYDAADSVDDFIRHIRKN